MFQVSPWLRARSSDTTAPAVKVDDESNYPQNRPVADALLQRIPMVAGLAYIERARRLPSASTVTLQAERDNRYFLHAIAVLADGEKIGFVAPEIARRYHAPMLAHTGPLTCAARHASLFDRQESGVELVLDFSELSVTPEA